MKPNQKNPTAQKQDKLDPMDALLLKATYLQKENTDLRTELNELKKQLATKELQEQISVLGSKYGLDLKQDKIDLNTGVITRAASTGKPLALADVAKEDDAEDSGA